MKEVFKTYGDMIIACVVVLALIGIISAITLFGRTGITAISGGYFEKRLNAGSSRKNCRILAFDEYKKLKASGVVFDDSSEIFARENRKVNDIFMTDTGERTGYKVIAIYDEAGEIISYETMTEEDELMFNEPGIYTVYCKSESIKGVSRITRLTIPVNRRNAL